MSRPLPLLYLTSTLSLGCLCSPAIAQITPDTTLGAEGSTVVPNLVIRGVVSDRIDGGAVRGINLFHSFLEFNVGARRGAYFSNPAGVENILSRVTGDNPSNILGRLGVLGNANLFLLNPNGILFGADASLDVSGSFMASTASAIRLGETGLYSAREPQRSTLLSVQPDALFLNALANQRGDLHNQGNLAVPQEQRLTLLGGTVTSTGSLQAAGGTVQVLGDRVALLDNALVDVSSPLGGGTVRIGGDFQGKGALPRAIATYISPNATIRANGMTSAQPSNGGQIAVWSDTSTRVYGSLSARGGEAGGNGGLIETSSAGFLDISGANVDASASNGLAGTWLLDPRNVIITSTAPSSNGLFSGTNPDIFTPTGDDAVISTADILARLATGTNVTITTAPPTGVPDTGTQAGNITLASPLDFDGIGASRSLTLSAQNNIFIDAPIGDSNPQSADSLNLALFGDSDNTGGGSVFINGAIATGGGNLQAFGFSPLVQGISIAAPINTGGGSITMTGGTAGSTAVASWGIVSYFVDINSGGGAVNLNGFHFGDGTNVGGVALQGNLVTNGGSVAINGFSTTGFGIGHFNAGVIDSGGGSISFDGRSNGGDGISADRPINSGTGNISFSGFSSGAGGAGVRVGGNGGLTSSSGAITLIGTSTNANGAEGVVSAAPITSITGNITLFGFSNGSAGVRTSSLSSSGGSILLDGRSNGPGIFSRGVETGGIVNSGGGNIFFTGFSRNAEGIVNFNTVTSGGGNISFEGVSAGTGGFARGIATVGAVVSNGGNIAFTGTGAEYGIASFFSPIDAGGGDFQLTSDGFLALFNSDLSRDTPPGGQPGVIAITADSILLSNVQIRASTSGAEDGTSVVLNARQGSVTIDGNSSITTTVNPGAAGSGGNIIIQGGAITNLGTLTAGTQGSGNSGEISLWATGPIDLSGTISTSVAAGATGNAGQIFINGGSINSRGTLAATTAGAGRGGTIRLFSSGAIDIAGNIETTTSSANPSGTGGSIFIRGNSIRNNATLNASTFGAANGGDVGLSATGEINLDSGSAINTDVGSFGNPFVSGAGGSISITSDTGAVNLDGNISTATYSSDPSGTGGRILIAGGSITSNAALNASTFRAAAGGEVRFSATGAVELDGNISTATYSFNPSGTGGNILIEGGSIISNAALNASTFGAAAGGSVRLSATGAVNLGIASTISTDVGSLATGAGGSISISGDSVLAQGATVSASTSSASKDGIGGDIDIRTRNFSVLDGAVFTTTTDGTAAGGSIRVGRAISDDGTITTNAENVDILNGGQLVATTTRGGNAGSIAVGATRINIAGFSNPQNSNQILVSGGAPSGLFTTSRGTGKAGNVSLLGGQIRLSDRALISASPQSSGQSGDIQLDVESLLLERGARIETSTTGNTRAGSITVNATNTVTLTGQNTGLFASTQDPLASTTTVTEIGDAGQLLETAQDLSLSGAGTVTSFLISGTLADGNDVDLYRILLAGNEPFSATTLGGADFDTQLFLFDGNGIGVIANDDSEFTLQSTLRPEALGIPTPGGIYFLAISQFNNDPVSQAGAIFDFVQQPNGTFEQLPVGPGASLPLSGWNNSGFGSGGNYTITLTGVVLPAELQNTDRVAAGGGNITINTGNLTITESARVSSSSEGQGKAGDVTVRATTSIDLNNSRIEATATGQGDAGLLSIVTGNLTAVNNSIIAASSVDGDGGDLTITSAAINLDNSRIEATATGQGDAGLLSIVTGNLTAVNNSAIAASSVDGDGGDLTITSAAINLDNSRIEATATGQGDAGLLSISTGNLTAANNSAIAASSVDGDGGDLTIAASNINLNQSRIEATATGQGNAGLLNISAANLAASSGSSISASAFNGKGGDLSIATTSINLDNSRIEATATGLGNSGLLTIFTRDLTLNNNSRVSVSTRDGRGGEKTGAIGIDIDNRRFVFGNVETIPSLFTFDTNQSGNLLIQATNSVRLRGNSTLQATAEGDGDAGNLAVVTRRLEADRSQISVSSKGTGRAGNLIVVADGIALNDRSELRADTSAGRGGSITVYVGPPLPLTEGQVSAQAFFKQGQTNASGNTIEIRGGSVISTSTISGQAGRVQIQGNNLVIEDDAWNRQPDRDRSRITSISQGSGSAGEIDIKLSNLLASTGGVISASAEAPGGSGGNIDITAKYVFLTNSSLIQTNVAEGRGDGGNIRIQVGRQFIALRDSDILANAIDGNGGNIRIQPAPGIRSIGFIADLFAPVQRNPGSLERFRNNGQVNINAESNFGISGNVETPDFSFLENNLTELANQLSSSDRLVSDRCIATRNQSQGSFVVTGTGGLPLSPYDSIRASYRASGVQTIEGDRAEKPIPAATLQPGWKIGLPIQEATGMTVTPDGRILLGTTAQLQETQEIWKFICNPTPRTSHSGRLMATHPH
ncbi:filamentous hemagglutinin N-terminal domain-containing protein [Leptothermofonsia sichuanensis E412]|uniref:two-partner secretion domain-containing protein n=1 Tax=Leptothermofonsia sichuanensis TaxID=2917832 RepID=UPI001CA74DC0|nr:filamentous hemagglutinin N-terminal domain-containing protein [Leptothermofonsia sichuanensis]QZZ18878.1 filamentous hemagglutinin N-terminal domain-containing protein [Leptothermofonsia sichuanensis E412]